MIVLDTNVVSEGGRPVSNPVVETWLTAYDGELFITGTTLMEVAYGATRFLDRTGSRKYFALLEALSSRFHGRVMDLVDPAPVICGEVRAYREKIGRPISLPDAMIAAICLVNGATLATRNVRDFADLDLKLVNPFEPAG